MNACTRCRQITVQDCCGCNAASAVLTNATAPATESMARLFDECIAAMRRSELPEPRIAEIIEEWIGELEARREMLVEGYDARSGAS